MWCHFTRGRKRERDELIRFALHRMHKGIVHVTFHAWLELLPGYASPLRPPVEEIPDAQKIKILQEELAALRETVQALARQVALQGSHSARTRHCMRALFSLPRVHCVWYRSPLQSPSGFLRRPTLRRARPRTRPHRAVARPSRR